MFCANCGTKQNEGEKFCPNCGTRFEEPLKVKVTKVEEVSKPNASKPENVVPEKIEATALIETETSQKKKTNKECNKKSTVKIDTSNNKEASLETTEKIAVKDTAIIEKITKTIPEYKQTNEWDDLKNKKDVDNSMLLVDINNKVQSGVISDKYIYNTKILLDSKVIHAKMRKEIYDEMEPERDVLRFKFYLDWNYSLKLTFNYNGENNNLSDWNLYYAIKKFNEKIDDDNKKDYYIRYDYKGEKDIVEALFTKKDKGFWGFLKAVPNEDELECRFREIYSICKRIRLL